MSRRLLQRGRYPKDTSLYPAPVSERQEQNTATTSMSYTVPSNVPMYNPHSSQEANQVSQGVWQQQQQQPYYGEQPIQAHYVPQQGSWHSSSSYYSSGVSENNVWNWMPENNANSISNSESHSQFHHPQASDPASNLNYTGMPSSTINNQVPGPEQQFSSEGQSGSSGCVPQNSWYPQNTGDIGGQNGNQYTAEFQQHQSNWEVIPQAISQAEQLPWTYNIPQPVVPQMSSAVPDWPSVKVSGTVIATSSEEGKNLESMLHSDTGQFNQENQNYTQLQAGSQEHSQESVVSQLASCFNQENQSYVQSQASSLEHSQESSVSLLSGQSCQSYLHSESNLENPELCSNVGDLSLVSASQEKHQHEQSPDSGTVGTFFHHSMEEEEEEEDGEKPTSQSGNVVSAETNNFQMKGCSFPKSPEDEFNKPVEFHQNEHYDDNTCENVQNVNQQCEGHQNRDNSPRLSEPCSADVPVSSASLVIEEPLNQEVPEPNDSVYSSSAHSAKQISDNESCDDHLNQQVPVENGGVTQQKHETQKASMKSADHNNDDDDDIQQVNLETIPDNLERPPDHEELKKHSSWHTSLHRHHLRENPGNLLSLSSTSLWDSPNIPHITLAPAAPPVSTEAECFVETQALLTKESCKESEIPVPEAQAGKITHHSSHECSTDELPNPHVASDKPSIPEQKPTSAHIKNGNSKPCDASSQECTVKEKRLDNHSLSVEAIPTTVSDSSSVQHIRNSNQHFAEKRTVKDKGYGQGHLDTTIDKECSVAGNNEEKSKEKEFDKYFENESDKEIYNSRDYNYECSNERDRSSGRYREMNSEKELERPHTRDKPYKDPKYFQQHDLEHNSRYDYRFGRDYEYAAARNNRPSTAGYENSRQIYQGDYRTDKSEERGRFPTEKFRSLDRRVYSDREGSRPPSRMSLNESIERPPFRELAYQKPYSSDNERPSSRMSESEIPRSHDPRAFQGPESGSRQYYDRQYQGPYHREEYYQRVGYTGYDYDPYQLSSHPYYGYYDPYRYGYSRYNYGYYDELYRNDPRYRQQVDEQYRDYYRRVGYETEFERSSVHSGRSSATELSKDTSQRYPEADASTELSYNQQSYGYTERQSQFSSFDVSDDQLNAPAAARLTPAKFTCVHAFGNFSATGQLVTVTSRSSSYGATPFVEIHDVQALLQNLDSCEELKQFPGPLVRGESHKSDLIEFCLQKVKHYKQKEGVPDRDSYVLLWELLILLLRQNGSVAGSDIAELLLKDHDILRHSNFKANTGIPHEDCSPVEGGDAAAAVSAHPGDTSSPDEGIVVTRDKTLLNNTGNMDVDKITRKFREFLLFGHKKDALEWAMKNGLWGHALFLASKMDLRTYANVMTRFANSLAMNDPLQTLYQLMSGRQPAAVTCVADRQWGDWRPHLAMILSNPSAHAEVDSKSITTLGDTLAAQGCLPAAHFCYLMAQVDFGSYMQKSSKLVLLSSDHRLPFEEFASNEAIQCTEIYEYVQSLANPGFMLNHLQAYKFIYATRLLDHGYLQEALHYCEVLSSNVLSNPDLFSINLITQVYELALKLKYYDPHYLQGQGELEEQDDPEWITDVSSLLNSLQQVNFEATPNVYEEVAYAAQNEASVNHEAEATPQPLQSSDTPNATYYTPQNQNYYINSMWLSGNSGSVEQQLQEQHQQQLQSPQASKDGQCNEPVVAQTSSNQFPSGLTSPQWNHRIGSQSPQEVSNSEAQPEQHIPSVPSLSSMQNVTSSLGHKRYDIYEPSQHVQTKSVGRERTDSTSSLGFQRDRHDSTVSSGSDYATRHSVPSSRKGSEGIKPEVKEEKPRAQVGRSWLGGIFSRLLPKPPNQMILPDDSNPTIVWDPVRKRWVNMESNDEDDSAQPAAPPTDTELQRKGSLDGMNPPTSLPPPVAAASTPVTNKFQRQKVKGMRQNYVDVLSNSVTATKATPPPDVLFPTMSPSQQNPSKLFIPSAPVSEDAPVDFVSSGQSLLNTENTLEEDPEVPKAPPMFDPAEFNSRRSSIGVRHGMGSARRTYPT